MPEFAPGEVKTARAPITVQPSGLSCSTEIYLVSNGAKVATSGVKPFTSIGAKQDISLPITMPSAEGTYPVYLDIFTNGLLIGAYKTTEDIIIEAALAGRIDLGLIWHEPLTVWEDAFSGREIPLNEEVHLAPGWINESEINIVGHVDLSVTYPDGTRGTLSAVLNQDKEAAPGNGWHVQFAPFLSTQEGTYTMVATLSSAGQVLDSVTFTLVAIAVALPFTFSNVSCNQKRYPFYSSWKTVEWWCTITNPNNAVRTQTLSLMYIYIKKDGSDYGTRIWWTFNLTLNPNQVYGFYYDGARYGERNPSAYNGPDIGTGAHITLWLKDANGNESPKCTA